MNHRLEIILFQGRSCGVCHALKPKLSELLQQKFSKVSFNIVQIEEQPNIAAKHSVFTLPVVILLIDNKEHSRWVGSFSMIEIEQTLTRVLSLL